MATTNFLPWNPDAINQENDATYLSDSQRTGGYGVDNIVPSATLNKATYQPTVFCAAFGEMMANKGYSTSDASVSILAAVLANIVTEADFEPNIIPVSYSPTPSFNAASSNGFQMLLSGNITSSTISGVSAGQLVAFYFTQDSVGGWTVSWPSSIVGTIQPDPAPNAVSVMLFRSDLSNTLRAVSPMISNNGIFATAGLLCPTREPGDDSTNAATTAFVAAAVSANALTATRTNKAGVYSAGVTYTNGPAAVYEEVTMIGPQNDNTGRSYSIRSSINGSSGPVSSITNYSYGYASIGFWVPAGATFTVTLTQDTGGTVSPPPSIYQWTEVSF